MNMKSPFPFCMKRCFHGGPSPGYFFRHRSSSTGTTWPAPAGGGTDPPPTGTAPEGGCTPVLGRDPDAKADHSALSSDTMASPVSIFPVLVDYGEHQHRLSKSKNRVIFETETFIYSGFSYIYHGCSYTYNGFPYIYNGFS